MARYVCAFPGTRDRYQVPLALAEADQLDVFITDLYATPPLRRLAPLLPGPVRAKLAGRHAPGLPAGAVQLHWSAALRRHAREALGRPAAQTWALVDVAFAEAAAAAARRHRSDLLLYAHYAWEALTADYAHDPRRVVFYFHPHPALERRVLAEDVAAHPAVAASYRAEVREDVPAALNRRLERAWEPADLILCASTFTKRSLVEAGADPARCRVVPYGVALPERASLAAPEAFEALFVGSGVQRKGLHHLLLAWRRAALPPGSRLTLVCRSLDPGLEAAVGEAEGVELRRGVGGAELARLYARSALFVMPSLVEGFGHVYLEALGAGCPVLGTAHTALPDLGGEADGIFLTEPADVDALATALERAARTLPGDDGLRAAARRCAERFTWPRFRQGLREALET